MLNGMFLGELCRIVDLLIRKYDSMLYAQVIGQTFPIGQRTNLLGTRITSSIV